MNVNNQLNSNKDAEVICPKQVECKEIEQVLRQSQGRYQSIVEMQRELIGRFLPNGKLTFVNQAFSGYFGKSSLETIGKNYFQFIPKRELKSVKEKLRSLGGNERIARIEHGAIGADGETYLHDWSYTVIVDDRGSIVEFQCVGREVFHRINIDFNKLKTQPPLCDSLQIIKEMIDKKSSKKTAKKQHFFQNEERFRNIFERAGIGIAVVDADGNFLQTNLCLERMLGYHREELKKMNYLQAIHPADRLAERSQLETGLGQTFEGTDLEKRFVSKTGKMIWGKVTLSNLPTLPEEPQLLIATIENITERKQAEESLRKSEATNRALLNAIPDIMFRVKADGTYVDFKPARFTGWLDTKIFTGLRLSDLLPSSIEEKTMASVAETLKTGEIQIFEYELAIGSEMYGYEARLIACGEDEVLAIVRDITARQRAELEKNHLIASLQTSEANLSQAQRVAHVGSWTYDFFSQSFTASEELCRIFEVALERRMSYRDFCKQIDRENRKICKKMIRQAIDLGGSEEFEIKIGDRDGNIKYIEIRTESVLIEGKLTKCFGTVLDITEGKKAQAALQESEAKYRALVNDAGDAILLISMNGKILEVNKKAEDLLGYRKEELIRMHAIQIHPDEEKERVMAVLASTAETGGGWIPNTRAIQKDGETVWVDISCSLVEWGEGQKVQQAILRDITYRVEVESSLKLQAERERSIAAMQERIRQSLDLREILDTTVAQVRQFLQCDRTIVYRFERDWSGVVVAEAVNYNYKAIVGSKIHDPCFTQNFIRPYQQGRIYLVEDIATANLSECHLNLLTQFQVKAILIVPILQTRRLWGWLIAHQCNAPRRWQQSEISFVTQLATQVGIATQQSQLYEQLKTANQKLKRLATLDGLTQLANRRRFNEYLEREWRRMARERAPLSLILCDIDFFKPYNDTYGHQAGDECLKKVAAAIQKALKRPADLVARYGGEEFAAILPDTEAKGAIAVAESIRRGVKQLQIAHQGSPSFGCVTVSVGVATLWPELDRSSDILIESADRALYRAKAQGRDRWSQSP